MSHARLRFLVGLACTVLSASSFAQPNVRIHPDNALHQIDVCVARDPVNPIIAIATAATVRTGGSFINRGFYFTTNGGETWTGMDTSYNPILPFQLVGSAVPVIDPNGTWYLFGANSSGGAAVTYSTNHGMSWSFVTTIASSGSVTQAFVIDHPSIQYLGRLFVMWADFTAAQPPIVVSHSSDGGATWTSPLTILPPTTGYYQLGVDGASGANGEAYVCWANPMSGSPFVSKFVGFARSTDGGDTWSGNTSMYACYGIRGILSGKGIRVDDFPRMGVDKSGGLRNGWIYIVTPEKNLAPAGNDPDIILHRSTDGGTTWSGGVRVNQDPLNNGKNQYAPSIAVDDSGGVNVIYYDDRNTSADSAEMYLSRSTDGGVTWRDGVVSDHRFKPKAIAGIPSGDSGEGTAFVSGEGTLQPFWTDDITGTSQVWTTRVPFITSVWEGNTQVPPSFSLEQNYPNPFNPSTEIGFRIAECGWTTLKVFDILGRQVVTLVNELKQPGTYTVPWNTSGMATGVYVYRLQAGNFTRQKKMLLVK